MIKDSLVNAEKYYNLSAGIKKTFLYIKENDLQSMADGKYMIDGAKLYINVNTYTTKDSADWEVHKKYIDVQYIISGEEKIGICNKEICTDKISYDKDRDIEFFDGDGGDFITMKTGDFMVIFPDEIHKPGMKLNSNSRMKKAVIKLAVDY